LTKKAVSSGWFLHSSNHHIPGANGTVDQAARILNVLAITKPHRNIHAAPESEG
jgi:hypothetical protein